MIDTHAHLDACTEPASALLARARAAGVERVVAVGSGIDSCRDALAATEAEDGVACALGIHPHQAGGEEAGRLDELRELLGRPSAVAVGETGLDFSRDYAPHAAQLQLFEAQLALADELGLPAVVHTRDAAEATADLLAGFRGTVVLHCFSSPPLLEIALERGYYVSFAGNVTFPKAAPLREAMLRVPSERLLMETDAPYLAPQAVRGKPNQPAYVTHTAQAIAIERRIEYEELERATEAAAARLFGW